MASNYSDFTSHFETASDRLRGVARDVGSRTSTWRHEAGARMQWRGGFTAEQPLPIWPESVIEPGFLFAAVDLARVIQWETQEYSSIPPGVLLLVAANCAAFSKPGGILASKHSLSPWCIVARKEYARLITSQFIHVNPVHLMGNVTSLISDGSYLERRCSLPAFICTTASASVLSSALYVGAAYLLAKHTGQKAEYYSTGVVGLSATTMALSTIAGIRRGGVVEVMGPITVPSEYKAWVQILQSQIFMPGSSFTGHLCGLVVGLLWEYVPRVFVCFVPGFQQRRGGTVGTSRGRGGPDQQPAMIRNGQIYRRSSSDRLREAASMAKGLAMHALCAAGCFAVRALIKANLKNSRQA